MHGSSSPLNEWEAAGRDPGYLLTGTRLDDYESWASTSRMQLTDVERTFLEESVRLREAAGQEDREREARSQRLRRRTRWQLVALFASVALLAGVVAYPILTDDGPPERIAVALTYDRDESGFDELIARGLENAAQDHGFEAVVLEPPYSSIDEAYADLAEDAKLVFGSFLMWDSMAATSAGYPDTTWVFLDVFGASEIPNGVAVSFGSEEGSFLVGAAAALESKTGKVGFIGANSSPLIEEFRAGFEQGAEAAEPGIEITSSVLSPNDWSSGFADEARAREIAEWMYTEVGVDVIYTAAGGSGRGVIEAATDLSDDLGRHLWAIGVDTDSVFELQGAQREHLLTSMVKRLDLGVERVVADYVAGTLEVPSIVRLGVADGAVGYTTSSAHLAPTTLAALRDVEASIVDGGLTVRATSNRPLSTPPGGSS